MVTFLRRNSRTMSLSTKLHLMGQLCAFMHFLHRMKIAFFVQIENLFLTRNLELRVRVFRLAYQVVEWVEGRKENEAAGVVG